MLTKTQIKIMQLFASSITKNFSLTDISTSLKLQYRVVHRAIEPLIKEKYIIVDNKRYRLNYKAHHQEIAYVESLRSKKLLRKRENGIQSLFVKDVLENIKEDQFVLIIFGSAVTKAKPRDVDVLLIVENSEKVDRLEKQLYRIAQTFTINFDIHIISHESVYEMLAKRDTLNVMNEILNKHIIFHGAETFYRLLTKGRK
jgi:hypothetical protein